MTVYSVIIISVQQLVNFCKIMLINVNMEISHAINFVQTTEI